MSELMTSLALVAYGTAAVMGIQLIASSFARLSQLAVRRSGRSNHLGDPLPQVAVTALLLLVAGLFLFLQGVVVVLWTFS